jgi:hypothetical protein
LGQRCRDLIVIFFGDKAVEAGLRLDERRIERPLLAIARVEMEFVLGKSSGWG